MIKGSDLLLSCLEEEGVEYVFGLPGEENLEFLQSLSESKKIQLILTRHEQAAGFMAATYGRLTGKWLWDSSKPDVTPKQIFNCGSFIFIGCETHGST